MQLFASSKIVVLASHDMGLLRSLCNKFLSLRGGEGTGPMTLEELDVLQTAKG